MLTFDEKHMKPFQVPVQQMKGLFGPASVEDKKTQEPIGNAGRLPSPASWQ
jgi:hypothetical protein